MLLFLRSFACRLTVLVLLLSAGRIDAQPGSTLLKWTKDGGSYYEVKSGNIVRVDIQDTRETVVVGKELLQPAGRGTPLAIRSFSWSDDGKIYLLATVGDEAFIQKYLQRPR